MASGLWSFPRLAGGASPRWRVTSRSKFEMGKGDLGCQGGNEKGVGREMMLRRGLPSTMGKPRPISRDAPLPAYCRPSTVAASSSRAPSSPHPSPTGSSTGPREPGRGSERGAREMREGPLLGGGGSRWPGASWAGAGQKKKEVGCFLASGFATTRRAASPSRAVFLF